MSVTKIAFRNLSRQKRRSFLLAGAIAFGVMVIAAVNGVAGGLLASAESNFAQLFSAHIMVTGIEFTDKNRMVMKIDDDTTIRESMQELSKTYPVKYFQQRTSVFNGATLVYQTESASRQIDGVDWAHDKFIADQLEIISGDKNLSNMTGSDGIILGEKTAKKLNIEVGDSLLVQSETIYGQQNVIEAPVKAIFKEAGLSGGTAYMDKAAVNGLLNMPLDSANWYGVFLEKFADQDAASLVLQKILADKKVSLYPREKVVGKDFNTLFGDLRKDKVRTTRFIVADLNDQLASMKGVFLMVKIVSLGVLIILLGLIMVGLNNTYRIIVWERNREIGTMRALGMQRKLVSRLFLLEALFLALGGVAGGFIVASVLLGIITLIPFGGSDFSIFLTKNHLAWDYDWMQLLITVLLVAGLTLLAARSPAKKAGKVDPAVALRTTA